MKKTYLLALAVGLSAAGCSSTPSHSGFLGDYSGLTHQSDSQVRQIYRKSGGDLSQYNKVIIEPVVFFFNPKSGYQGVRATDLQYLANYFEKAMINALSNRYPIVQQPGPGVLKVRAAITDLVMTNPRLIQDSTTAGFADPAVPGQTIDNPDVHIHIGGASMEAEMVDSQSGERLVAAVDWRGPDITSRDSMGSWDDAKKAFDFWAGLLRQGLDEAHQ